MLLDMGRQLQLGSCTLLQEKQGQLELQARLPAMPKHMDLLRASSSQKKLLNSSEIS